MTFRRSIIALALLGLTSTAGNLAFAADPIKIGLLLPMSGPFAAYGKQIEHGVKLYLAAHGDMVGGRANTSRAAQGRR